MADDKQVEATTTTPTTAPAADAVTKSDGAMAVAAHVDAALGGGAGASEPTPSAAVTALTAHWATVKVDTILWKDDAAKPADAKPADAKAADAKAADAKAADAKAADAKADAKVEDAKAAPAPAAAAAAPAPKPVSEKDRVLAELKAALATDDYVVIFDALEAAERLGLADHKLAVEAQGKLALFMKQMETFEVLDRTATSRDAKAIELALNLAEEYFLEKTVECKRVQTIRDTMQQMFRDLEYACRVDHTSVDDQLKKMLAYGIPPDHDACVAALEKRKVLFARAQVVDKLKATTASAATALRAIQKKLQFAGGAGGAGLSVAVPASPRPADPTKTPKTPGSGVSGGGPGSAVGEGKVGGGHGRSSSMGNVPHSSSNPDLAGAAAAAPTLALGGGSGATAPAAGGGGGSGAPSPTSPTGSLDISALLDEHTAQMATVLAEAKALAITATEPAYEAAKIKFAELQMEQKLVAAHQHRLARGHARKTSSLAGGNIGAAGAADAAGGDDAGVDLYDDDAKTAKVKSKRAPGQEADDRIDPYNPKSGSLPPLEPEVYAIPKLALHNYPRLRSPDEFARGVVFNRKRYALGMLIWQSDKLERSLTRPPGDDTKREAAYNATAHKIFANIQTFMGDRHAPTGAGAPPLESYATDLMKLGYKQPEVRDEIYVQVLKQLTCHPKPAHAVAGWQLLGLVCEAFPPSAQLAPHVFHVMYPHTKADAAGAAGAGAGTGAAGAAAAAAVAQVPAYATYCMHTLWNTVHEPPKPITDFTLEHVRKIRRRRMVAGKVRIYFLDGSEMDLHVEPHTRVCDSLRHVFVTIGLVDRAGFGIFSVGTVEDGTAGGDAKKEGREIWVPLNSCLLDYDPQPRPSVSPVLYKAQSARLVFKRRLGQDLSSTDKLAQKLLYYQTLVSICDEGLPCSEKQLHRFLALHRVIDAKLATTPVAVANMLTAVAVKNILPHFVEGYSAARTEKYLEKVAQAKAALANLKPSWDALINEVREWTLFGCSYFTAKPAPVHETAAAAAAAEAKSKKEGGDQKGLMLGISSQGVFLVAGRDKKLVQEFPFFLIQSFAIDASSEHVSLVVRDKTDKLKKAVHTHRFYSKEAEEILALLTTIQEDIHSKTEVES